MAVVVRWASISNEFFVPVRCALTVAALQPLLCFVVFSAAASAQNAPLPSWNDGPTKQAIIEFVRATTDSGSAHHVPPALRIATFDNDGTLWVEKPIYTQVVFAVDRVKALAPEHPDWKTEEPFKLLLKDDLAALTQFTMQDFTRVIAETHSGMTVAGFRPIVRDWLATAKHPRFDRLYTELVYEPMIELLAYLRDSGYATYIATGGGQEFVRVFSPEVYGIPPEQVIGTAGRVNYEYAEDGRPVLVKQPEVLEVNDKSGKPEGIHLVIGRRPHAAFGNSTGDREMLEWTGAGAGERLMMLVHHDDAVREYSYGPNSKVGTFSDALMAEAKRRGWIVISMKNDWKRIYSFDE